MKGYTEFGKFIRKKMIDHNENLMELGKLLNVSTAFVSAVLTGNKSIPDGWDEILAEHYKLNAEEKNALCDAYCNTKSSIRIEMDSTSLPQRRLAIQFQRKLNSLSDEEIKSLFEILDEEGK